MSDAASILDPASLDRAAPGRGERAPLDGADRTVRLAVPAMGTRFEFVLRGSCEHALRDAGEAAIREVVDQHARLSAFDRSSEVSRINREAGRRSVAIDGEMFDLLEACAVFSTQTRGCFDITVGPLMRAWGFRGTPADEREIQRAGALTGSDGVVLDRTRGAVRFAREGMAIDLGGVAKGYALDLAASALRDAGVRHAFMHGGTSTAVAIGDDACGSPWRVRLGPGDGSPVASIVDGALSVSAPHGRMTNLGPRRIGHVLDPRSGGTVASGRRAAALATAGIATEVWSTALLVIGAAPAWLPASIRGGVENDDGHWTWSSPGPTDGRTEGSGDGDGSA